MYHKPPAKNPNPPRNHSIADAVEIVVVADRSGSMDTIKADAIGGYNAFLVAQKRIKNPAVLSLVLFDNEYSIVADRVWLASALPLTAQTYLPRGGTALYDAIGRTLSALLERNPARAIVAILTDGQENSSVQYSGDRVREMIRAAEARGWQVLYLSADAFAFADAKTLGVASASTTQFARSSAGVRSAYGEISLRTSNYRGG